MPDCFICYSAADEPIAEKVRCELLRNNLSVFMASNDVQPGKHWSSEILNNLRNSEWVIVLASKAACASAFVNQEIGGALLATKQVIPIVWDMSPTELPGWAKEIQAIDLKSSIDQLSGHVRGIAARIKEHKAVAFLIILGLVAVAVIIFFIVTE